MKPKKLTLLFLSLLAILLIGAAATLLMPARALVAEQVKFEPKPFELDNPDTVIAHVKLSVDDVPIVDQIDPDTVYLEGGIAPFNTYTTEPGNPPGAKPEFIAEFNGLAVKDMLISKISHMGLTTPQDWVPIKIWVTITGYLTDGTTPWEGTGYIKTYIHNPVVPPPPPPPP